MYQLECKNFYCVMRKTCLYEGSCDKCKITPCDICVFKKSCDYNKERVKMENDLQKIINHYGYERQLDMCVEECAELIQAISKFKRKRDGQYTVNLIEEIADVEIMLSQLKMIFTCKCEVTNIIDWKIKRQLERIDNESKI